ncbi:MAG: ABC transporter ATP-binding protein, partial [Firmicutes bacterium]|nr:ABC transporter ATP-binding protein [Bacillota bacterium]
MILIIIGALLLSTLYPLFADASRKIVISIEEKEPNAILTFSLVAILVFIGRSIVQLMNGYLMTLFGGKVCLDIQSDLINHINSVPYEYFQKNHSGDIIARLLNDVQGIGGVLSYSGISLIQIPLNATASIIYGLTLSPIMTIGLMLIGPIPLVFNKIFGDRLRALANEARKVWAGIYGLTTDILKGSDVV